MGCFRRTAPACPLPPPTKAIGYPPAVVVAKAGPSAEIISGNRGYRAKSSCSLSACVKGSASARARSTGAVGGAVGRPGGSRTARAER